MLMSCETRYTYVFQRLDTHAVMLYTTTSIDTAQIIDNCKNYISVVPFSVEKKGIIDIKSQASTWTDADGNRSVTPYVGEEPVIWFEPVEKITHEKSYKTLATAAATIALLLFAFLVYFLNSFSNIRVR